MQPQLENWVICRIFLKKTSTKNEEDIPKSQSGKLSRSPVVNDSNPVFYDFLAKEKTDSASSSSSGSSGITDVSFNQSEESSSCNSTLSTFSRKPCP